MSDTPQGPGWWQASDGKYYPPDPASGGAPAGGVAPTGQYAEWGQRAIGYIIDMALAWAIIFIGYVLAAILGSISGALGGLMFLLTWLASVGLFLYYGYLVGLKGSSPGMAMTGLRCVSEETGQILGGGGGVVRSIAGILNGFLCYLGYLFPLWDPKKQTIGDKLVKTVVYADQPKQSFSLDLFKP